MLTSFFAFFTRLVYSSLLGAAGLFELLGTGSIVGTGLVNEGFNSIVEEEAVVVERVVIVRLLPGRS